MRMPPSLFFRLREEIGTLCTADKFEIEQAELYLGPTPICPAPCAVFRCSIDAESFDRASFLKRLGAILEDAGLPEFPATLAESDADADIVAAAISSIAAQMITSVIRLDMRSGIWKPEAAAEVRGWFEYFLPSLAWPALTAAAMAVAYSIERRADRNRVAEEFAHFMKAGANVRPSIQSLLLINVAQQADLPFRQIASSWAIWQFGWGSKSRTFWSSSSTSDSALGASISTDKACTKRFFRQIGIPTPNWHVLSPDGDIDEAAKAIGWPCVAKPLARGGGMGVTASIFDRNSLVDAVAFARQFSDTVLIESHVGGHDYRLMVIDGQLMAAVRRDPPAIIGDGRSDVQTLIDALNHGREKTVDFRKHRLKPVPDDTVLAHSLAAQGVTRATVLEKGRRIQLRSNANFSTGGTPVDVLHTVHPEVRQMAERMTVALGLRAAGVDYLSADISRPWSEVGGSFIEINTTPGLDLIINSGSDPYRLGALLLGETTGRIPVDLVLASTAELDMLEEKLGEHLGNGQGIVSPKRSRLGNIRLPDAAMTSAERVAAMLRYDLLERLTILWDGDTLNLFGLPVDRVDTTIVAAPGLSADWLSLLGRQSRTVHKVSNSEEALRLLAWTDSSPCREE